MNAKVFNLVVWVNKAKFLVQHESCECKKLDSWSSCNDNHMWTCTKFDC